MYTVIRVSNPCSRCCSAHCESCYLVPNYKEEDSFGNEAQALEHIHNNGLNGYTYLIRRLRDNYIVGEVKL